MKQQGIAKNGKQLLQGKLEVKMVSKFATEKYVATHEKNQFGVKVEEA